MSNIEQDGPKSSIRQKTSNEIEPLHNQLNTIKGQLRKPRAINVPDHFAATEQLEIFRRNFKIAGQFGEPGQPNKLKYIRLIHQIDAGLK